MAKKANFGDDIEWMKKVKVAGGKTLYDDQKEYEARLAGGLDLPSQRTANQQPAKAAESQPRMNGLETEYARYLDVLKFKGEIIDWRFQPFKLFIASPKCWYTIDFMVINRDSQIELHETKGPHAWEDSLIKFKVASTTLPMFIFKWVKKSDTGWDISTLHNGKWTK